MRARRIGFGVLVAAIVASVAGLPGQAATGNTSVYAPVLQAIFSNLQAKGFDMTFGGPIAAPLGFAGHNPTLIVRELTPVRDDATGIVRVFYGLEDGSGYIVVRFSSTGFVAWRFDRDFNCLAAATSSYDGRASALSDASMTAMLGQEMPVWRAIAQRMNQQR